MSCMLVVHLHFIRRHFSFILYTTPTESTQPFSFCNQKENNRLPRQRKAAAIQGCNDTTSINQDTLYHFGPRKSSLGHFYAQK